MRNVIIKFKDKEYFDFQTIANQSGLTPEEKLREIVGYYLIIEKNRKKFSQKLL